MAARGDPTRTRAHTRHVLTQGVEDADAPIDAGDQVFVESGRHQATALLTLLGSSPGIASAQGMLGRLKKKVVESVVNNVKAPPDSTSVTRQGSAEEEVIPDFTPEIVDRFVKAWTSYSQEYDHNSSSVEKYDACVDGIPEREELVHQRARSETGSEEMGRLDARLEELSAQRCGPPRQYGDSSAWAVGERTGGFSSHVLSVLRERVDAYVTLHKDPREREQLGRLFSAQELAALAARRAELEQLMDWE